MGLDNKLELITPINRTLQDTQNDGHFKGARRVVQKFEVITPSI